MYRFTYYADFILHDDYMHLSRFISEYLFKASAYIVHNVPSRNVVALYSLVSSGISAVGQSVYPLSPVGYHQVSYGASGSTGKFFSKRIGKSGFDINNRP